MMLHVHWALCSVTNQPFHLEGDAVGGVMLSKISAEDAKNVISLAGDQLLTGKCNECWDGKCFVRLSKVTCLTLLGKTGPFTGFCSC